MIREVRRPVDRPARKPRADPEPQWAGQENVHEESLARESKDTAVSTHMCLRRKKHQARSYKSYIKV